jgi:hypothetical protein
MADVTTTTAPPDPSDVDPLDPFSGQDDDGPIGTTVRIMPDGTRVPSKVPDVGPDGDPKRLAGPVPDTSDQCPRCEGTGTLHGVPYDDPCALCSGTGLMSVAVTGGDAEPARVPFVSSKAAAFAEWAKNNPEGLAAIQKQMDSLPGHRPEPATVDTTEDDVSIEWERYRRTLDSHVVSRQGTKMSDRLAASLREARAELEKARFANATFDACLPEIMAQRDTARAELAAMTKDRDEWRSAASDGLSVIRSLKTDALAADGRTGEVPGDVREAAEEFMDYENDSSVSPTPVWAPGEIVARFVLSLPVERTDE